MWWSSGSLARSCRRPSSAGRHAPHLIRVRVRLRLRLRVRAGAMQRTTVEPAAPIDRDVVREVIVKVVVGLG